jgi:hypothetical protein
MPKQNFKSHAKRKRELAKLDKRAAKDQKRASRRGDPLDGPVAVAAVATAVPSGAARGAAPVVPKPLTLAEAVERWKNTPVVKAKHR